MSNEQSFVVQAIKKITQTWTKFSRNHTSKQKKNIHYIPPFPRSLKGGASMQTLSPTYEKFAFQSETPTSKLVKALAGQL
jgi:hypothetical protein